VVVNSLNTKQSMICLHKERKQGIPIKGGKGGKSAHIMKDHTETEQASTKRKGLFKDRKKGSAQGQIKGKNIILQHNKMHGLNISNEHEHVSSNQPFSALAFAHTQNQ